MVNHLRAQITNFFVLESEVPYEERPVREVNCDTRQRFIQWRFRVSKSGQAGAVAEAFVEGGAEGEEGVFGGVVIVNWIAK